MALDSPPIAVGEARRAIIGPGAQASGRGPGPRSIRTGPRVLFLGTLIPVAAFVLPPLFWLVFTSFTQQAGGGELHGTLQYFRQVAQTLAQSGLIWNTIAFSLGGAIGAVVFGTTIAWLVERTDVSLRWLPYMVAFALFTVPGVLKIVGWTVLLNKNSGFITRLLAQVLPSSLVPNVYSLPGMILVWALILTPMTFLFMATAFRNIDPSLEEAASVSGAGRATVFFRVTLQLAKPALLASFLLTLIEGLTALEVPLFLGMPESIFTLTAEIYDRIGRSMVPQYGPASAVGVTLMTIVTLLLLLYQRAVQAGSSFRTVTGKGFRPRRIQLGRWRPVGTLMLVFLQIVMLAPIITLLWISFLRRIVSPVEFSAAMKAFTLQNYVVALNDRGVLAAAGNSLAIAVVSATGAVLLAASVSWLTVRAGSRATRALDILASLPLVVPGVLMGLGVLLTYVRMPIVPIYGTIWLLIFAYVPMFLPFALRYAHSGLLSIHPELEESARMSGATTPGLWRRIILPLLGPSLMAGWLFAFLISIRELNAALLLYGPTTPVISALLYEQWNEGSIGLLSAFGLLVTGGALIVAIFVHRRAKSAGF